MLNGYNDKLKSEVERLSKDSGIGLIKLDLCNPDNSTIICEAKKREPIDIETMNKIAEANDIFKNFLNKIKADIEYHKKIKKDDKYYDPVLPVDELVNKGRIINKLIAKTKSK